MQQYKEDSNDDDTSTWQRARTLSSKKSLLRSDIVEKGGAQLTYSLHPDLLEEATRVVNELQIFLERTSAMIPERTSYFKVDPRDTFLSILKESSDLGQIHAAWMGLSRRLTLAQENLMKYEIQYKGPIEGEGSESPLSPISTDIGIYEAIEGEEDKDFRMRYIYENVPHHQDQIHSPRKLRDNSPWSSIIPLPNHAQDTSSSTLPTIPEQESVSYASEAETSKRDKGKRRITDEFVSPPSSPRIVNVGYGTPFKSSSQFFVRPGIPLPPSETLTQRNVLVGLGLPETPAFENISNTKATTRNSQRPIQPRASNPFEGRDLPPHMNAQLAEQTDNVAYLPSNSTNQPTSTQANVGTSGPIDNSRHQREHETSSIRESSGERRPLERRRGRSDPPDDDPDGDDDGDSSGPPRRSNNPPNRNSSNRNRPTVPSGGGGGGGNPGGGGDGDGPSGNGHQPVTPQSNIPYGNLVATIRTELKQEQLPIWDGNKDTAIEYFWKVQQLAALEGDIPVALGFWLWKSLKENSKIWMWFTTLPFAEQAKMRTHYLHYLKGIKDNYLGRSWQISMNRKYESQSFRQEGFERESPPAFIVRRIMYTRMLVASDDGGPTEVYLVMQKAPISWGPILNLETIRSTSLLYSRATDHELALVHAAKYESSNVLTSDNLLYTLRKLGIQVDRNRPFDRSAKLVASRGSRNETEDEVIHEAFLGQLSREECTHEINSDPNVMKEALQVLKKRQRPPPKGGYPYSKNDHVTTKMGRLPPSPCKVCGSANHWDKECPDWAIYEAKQLKSAYRIEIDEDEDLEGYYSSVYSVLVTERLSLESDQAKNSEQVDFDQAVLVEEGKCRLRERKSDEPVASWKKQTVFMEEVEDDFWKEYASLEKSERHLLYQEGDEDDEAFKKEAFATHHDGDKPDNLNEDLPRTSFEPTSGSPQNDSPYPSVQPQEIKDPTETASSLPPPSKECHFKLPKRRSRPEGTSAVGVSVLSARGFVGSLKNAETDLRLDSCADITLISYEFYESLAVKPSIKQGMRLQLWQLTDKDSKLKGFVRIPIFMTTESGDVLETEAEAYVVPNMTVPILLGEDYQQSYEVSVTRNVELGTHVGFGQHDHRIRAVPVERTNDFGRLRQSTYMANQFVRRQFHRRNKAKRHRQKVKFGTEERTVRASEDYKLKPHESKPIRVEGHLGEDREWLVQKNLLANANDSFFAVPNVLISAANPWVPIANPTDHPRYIRKGEIIGTLTDPASFFDTPKSSAELEKFQAAAEVIRTVISLQTQHQGSEEPEQTEGEQEDYGPKTAAMPDPTVYPSDQLESLIDVGTLPESLKEKAWAMLRKRIKAFGFDGRLGSLPTKVHIRTVDGQVPISAPMYNASPQKRVVIDEQIDKWFEQGVIEPSKSPWSAPVVIAYRNGKPRFCIDYRKLNAVTIPDEFPIPRQSDILASLSGAQVLSSLDALSGFTQLELAEEDIEKTAFRSHRGLFQFKRLPFGLRNGPSIFQRVMQSILAPYLWIFCLVYIDDIVIYSKSYEEHLVHLDKVLEAIENAGITLSPKKCHLFYGSILLLGHKVSRLGLSTHAEKVRAIMELERPRKLSQLQAFLGMVVYFSAFIPYYASVCAPLFQLLRKGCKWHWGVEQEHAFESAKVALKSSPVLGHPMEGLPYRLYTDASDEALGCSLQQVQPIKVSDLKGTRTYDRLEKAFDNGLPPPRLVTAMSSKGKDLAFSDEWASTFDDTVVHVERVIGYWSRLFKSAETRYSTTEREALAAKEGLVKFQPFIEGEDVLLITDHSALQWARTYENANRRLAAWGAIFSAYAPKLEIIHRAGRVHSNVDPLSRLPRAPPSQISPMEPDEPSIRAKETLDERQEVLPAEKMAAFAFAFAAWSIEDCLDTPKEAMINVRSRNKRSDTGDEPSPGPETDELDTLETSSEYWGAMNPAPTVHLTMSDAAKEEWRKSYQEDPMFKTIAKDATYSEDILTPGRRFFVDKDGMIFFNNENYQPRLCVPVGQRNLILKEAHESPFQSAHAGPERLWQSLSSRFYWKRMKVDIMRYCSSCDICQKTKSSNFNKFGLLIPNPIPSRPYQSISMDFIVNLPWSEGFNAIFVVVDRLTKHASFVPVTTGLDTEGFALLFVKHIACKFGLPESIITDRDPRWTTDFWRGIAKALQTRMSLSSSHHPQHDGQTEVVNKLLTTMIRAFIAGQKDQWAAWIHLLEFAYNSTVHSSIGTAPFHLLLGFHPRTPLDFVGTRRDDDVASRALTPEAVTFLDTLEMHRDSARRAIAKAQNQQVKSYNKGRKPVPELKQGDRVLVNPHALEWLESKGEGKKLTQRWIGPFEVIQRVNPNVYRLRMSSLYPGLPVFNYQHLKKYVEAPPEYGERATLPETRTRKPAEEEYEVEKIIAERRTKKGLEYLIRWEGYSPLYDTWEPKRSLKNAPEVVSLWQKRKADEATRDG